MALSNLRLGQKTARGAHALFTGVLSAVLIVADPKKLTFQANVRAMTGDEVTPFVEYTPCDDYGKPKTFSDVDGLITWLKGAYLDITGLSLTVEGMASVSNVFVPPSDPIADATKQKAKYTKLRDGMLDNVNAVNAKVAAAVASGWNAVNAHPALKANYDELVAQQTATQNINNFYVAEIARYNAIIAG